MCTIRDEALAVFGLWFHIRMYASYYAHYAQGWQQLPEGAEEGPEVQVWRHPTQIDY